MKPSITRSLGMRRCETMIASLLLLLVLYLPNYVQSATVVSIQGRNIIVNGTKFFAHGVTYGNTPIGQWADSKQGCCTWDWVSQPEVYMRDLPYLHELNANTIRLYNWRGGVNHNAFLDECYKRGIYVIAAYQWKWNVYNNGAGKQQMRNDLIQMVNNHKNHPAIIMWLVGNELNAGGRGYQRDVWSFVQELKDLLHQTEAPNWRPVGSPLADGSSMWEIISNQGAAVDVWLTQLYKGRTFYDYWTRYAAASTKPMLITEYGVDSYIAGVSTAEGEAQQAAWESSMWSEIMAHTDVCSGALKFNFHDGWFKCPGGATNLHETCPLDGGNRFPGGQVNEEYFGMMAFTNTQTAVNGADTVRVKETFCTYKKAWKNFPRSSSMATPSISGCPEEPAVVEPTVVTPAADASVRGGAFGNNNYGQDSVIQVKYANNSDFVRESFLRFDLSSVSSNVLDAKLILTISALDQNVAFPMSVDLVTNDAWTESGITYSNKPTNTRRVAEVTRGVGENTITVNVTQQVRDTIAGDKLLSLRLFKASGTDQLLQLYSKESSSNKPRIQLSFGTVVGSPSESGTQEPTPTENTESSNETGSNSTQTEEPVPTDFDGAADISKEPQVNFATTFGFSSVLCFLAVVTLYFV